MLCRERRRTERSGDPFVLALIDLRELQDRVHPQKIEAVCAAVHSGIRDTDLAGWYERNSVIGILYTALCEGDRDHVRSALHEKVDQTLGEVLCSEEIKQVVVSLHFFPEDHGRKLSVFESDKKLYPDIIGEAEGKGMSAGLKRILDIAGSVFILLLFIPFFLIIPVLIKLASKGPVLFKQKRIGKFGKEFAFLKFRTMYVNNDPTIHQQYVRQLIAQGGKKSGAGVFKITNDPRVTPIGRFLRKTSLDELPQFLNVLKGDMSIVGPRPPIPYEFAAYRFWHRRRVVEVRPGITGLWQVTGRSKTSFDDMVRLDLQYIKKQSFWLDLKIIFRTPGVLISGDGAY